MTDQGQRLAVLLFIAFLICLVHGAQEKHLRFVGDIGQKKNYVWLEGLSPAMYALPATGIPQNLLSDSLGIVSGPGRVYANLQPESRQSYLVTNKGILKKSIDSFRAAPFFYLPIPLNQTDAETLMTIPGLGKILSERIIDYRKKHGKFTSLDELELVEGVGELKLNKLKKYLVITK